MNIFPAITLVQTEIDVINDKLSDPAVKKYLHMLAYNNAQSMVLGQPAEGESAESYLRRAASVQGRLEVLETLLSIKPTL